MKDLGAYRPPNASQIAIGTGGSALDRRRRRVLLFGDLVTPAGGRVVVVDLVEGEVDHEAVRCGAMPVVLVGLEEDAVAGADELDRATAALAEADALGHVDGLAERVGVPGGSRAGGEVDEVGLRPCGGGRGGDRVDVDVIGEPVARTLGGIDAAAGDLHRHGPSLGGPTGAEWRSSTAPVPRVRR